MFQSLANLFEKLISEFTWARFFVVFSLLVTVLIAFAVFEYYTAHFRLSRLEREIALVERVADLDQRNLGSALEPARARINEKLNAILTQGTAQAPLSPTVVRVLAGLFPWFLFVLVFLPRLPRDPAKTMTGMLGALVTGVLLSLLGLLLPADLPWSLLYLAYPLIAFFVVVATVVFFGRRIARRRQAQTS